MLRREKQYVGQIFVMFVFWNSFLFIMNGFHDSKENEMRRSIIAILLALTLMCAFSFSAYASTNAKVNINTASARELSSLHRIGEKYSQRIVEYRKTVGPFQKPEDIMKVKGISDKIFEMNKERIVVKDDSVEKKS